MVVTLGKGLETTEIREPKGFGDMTGGLRIAVDSGIAIADDEGVQWQFERFPRKKEMTFRVNNADVFVGRRHGVSHAVPNYMGILGPQGLVSIEDPTAPRSITWTVPPPEERRLQYAIELDRAEIGFDETAASVLGRLYDLGHASVSELDDWFQSAEQWIAFSRLQRCRYVEDLGDLFTLSRDGREFVGEMLTEDTA